MTIGNLVFSSITNFLYFRRLPIPGAKKRKIFFTFIKINTAFIVLVKLLRMRRTKATIVGYRMEGYDYGSLCFLFNEIFYRGEYAFATNNSAPVILDCGANIGMATLFFKWLFPDCTVHAFEPNPEAFAMLQKNVADNNLQSVHLYNVALTDVEGDITFYTDVEEKGSLRASMIAERMAQQAHTVSGKRLSAFIGDRVDFLKLDVEGAETNVLKDLTESAALKKIDRMVIEYHHHLQPTGSYLAGFLAPLEQSGFEYQLNARAIPITAEAQFQDIMIHAYRV